MSGSDPLKEVVEKLAGVLHTVIPAWLHSSGVDGGNPVPCCGKTGMLTLFCH